VVLVLVYAIMLGLALGTIVSLARLATELPKYASEADGLVSGVTAQLAAFGVGPEQLQQAAGALDLGKLAGVLGGLLSSIAGLASNFVFLLVLLLFLSVEAGGVGDRLASIAVDRPRITEALRHFAWGTRQYLIVTTVFGLIVAVLDSVALALLGIPLAVTWGLLAFITNFIPNIGFVIGVVPPALLGLLTGGPSLMIIVIIVYCALNFVVQSIIQPRFIGDAVGLSVTVTFVALVFWAWLLGPLGPFWPFRSRCWRSPCSWTWTRGPDGRMRCCGHRPRNPIRRHPRRDDRAATGPAARNPPPSRRRDGRPFRVMPVQVGVLDQFKTTSASLISRDRDRCRVSARWRRGARVRGRRARRVGDCSRRASCRSIGCGS
jgi:hypothetical protein